jgi:glycine cleavage system protein P-like pyridoxal-binding family
MKQSCWPEGREHQILALARVSVLFSLQMTPLPSCTVKVSKTNETSSQRLVLPETVHKENSQNPEQVTQGKLTVLESWLSQCSEMPEG